MANRGQATLTASGIVVGIVAVILGVAITQGGGALIVRELEEWGTHLVFLDSAQGGPYEAALDHEDVQRLLRLPGVLRLAPVLWKGSYELRVGQQASPEPVSVIATTPDYQAIRRQHVRLAEGRFLVAEDLQQRRPVVVLGYQAKQALFGSAPAVGEEVTLAGHRLTVVGVLAVKKRLSFGSDGTSDLTVFVPTGLLGEDRRIPFAYVQLSPTAPAEVTAARMLAVLRERYGTWDGKDKFSAQSLQAFVDTARVVTRAMTGVMAAIAGITLVVAGIGTMNTLLMAVTSRTREIGLRRALGASRRLVLAQFLAEAALLTLGGGLVGTVLGLVGAQLAAVVVGLPRLTLWWAPLLSSGVSVAVGLAAGLYPAVRAAQMDVAEALRYE